MVPTRLGEYPYQAKKLAKNSLLKRAQAGGEHMQ